MKALFSEVLLMKQLKIDAIVRHHSAALLNSKGKLLLIGESQPSCITHG